MALFSPEVDRTRRRLLVGVGLIAAVWLFLTPFLQRVRPAPLTHAKVHPETPVDVPEPAETVLRARVAAAPSNESAQLDLIAHLLDARRSHEALEAARAALPWLPASRPLRLALSEALLRAGFADQVLGVLRAVPSDPETSLLKAEAQLSLGQPAKAVAAIAKLRSLEPDIVLHTARVFARAGVPERGIGLLTIASARAPEDITLRRALSSVLIQAGKFQEAVRLWNELRSPPEGASDWYEIGVARLLNGGGVVDPAAISALKSAVDAAPEIPLYRHAYAAALLRDHRAAAAVDELKAIADGPGAPAEALADLAMAERQLGLAEAAALDQARYLRQLADPNAALAVLKSKASSGAMTSARVVALGASCREAGDPARAIELLSAFNGDPAQEAEPLWETYRAQTRAALNADALATLARLASSRPDDLSVTEAQAETLQALRRFDEARAVLESLQQRERRNPLRPYSLGLFYVAWSDDPRRDAAAERYFREAIHLNPRFPGPRYRLGALYLRQGRYREAIGQLRRSLGLSPSHAEALRALGQAYQRVREPRLADEAFRLFRRRRSRDEREEALLLPDRTGHPPLRNRLALADLYLIDGRTSEALKQLEIYSHFTPLSADRRKTLATLYGMERRYLAQATVRNPKAQQREVRRVARQ